MEAVRTKLSLSPPPSADESDALDVTSDFSTTDDGDSGDSSDDNSARVHLGSTRRSPEKRFLVKARRRDSMEFHRRKTMNPIEMGDLAKDRIERRDGDDEDESRAERLVAQHGEYLLLRGQRILLTSMHVLSDHSLAVPATSASSESPRSPFARAASPPASPSHLSSLAPLSPPSMPSESIQDLIQLGSDDSGMEQLSSAATTWAEELVLESATETTEDAGQELLVLEEDKSLEAGTCEGLDADEGDWVDEADDEDEDGDVATEVGSDAGDEEERPGKSSRLLQMDSRCRSDHSCL